MFNVEEIINATKGRLLKGNPGLRVTGVSTDSRNINPGELFIGLKGKNFDGHNFILNAARKKATAFLVERRFLDKNRGFLASLAKESVCIAVDDNLKGLGDLAQYWRGKFAIPLIAVTGSSGKTTTKEMISAVLGIRYKILKTAGTENNFVGVPLNLLKLRQSHEIACIELGTSSFGEIKRLTAIVKPNAGIITNIGESHLEKLQSRQGVFKEKKMLLKGEIMPAISLLNYDDEYLNTLKGSRKNIFGFSKDNPSDFLAEKIHFDKQSLNFKLNSGKQKFAIRTFGVHNIYNALAAIGMGLIFGIDQKAIASELMAFKFPASRFNIIKGRGCIVIDDTYNANPLSLASALLSLAAIRAKGRKILVIADMLELGENTKELHRQSGAEISRKNIDFIISMGNLAKNVIAGALENNFDRRKTFSGLEYGQIVRKLSSIIKNGDIILVKGSHAMHMERVVDFLKKSKKA